MAQQTINIGASPNDGTGTPLRTAFQYTNSNFSELYTAVGPSGNNIVVPGNATITGAATVGTTLGVTGVSTFAAGTALLPGLTTTGDTNTGIYYPAADTFAVTTGGTERYRVDSSGNVGIGVTPSAWGGSYKALQLLNVARSIAATGAGSGDLTVAFNAIYDSTDSRWEYAGTGDKAGRYSQTGSGNHRWFVSNTAGTAGNEITDFASPAMTLDASGNLLVAATSTSLTTGTGLKILQNSGVTTVGTVGSSSSDVDTTYRLYSSTASAYRFYVGYGGTVYATNTTISAISDARLKENVQDIDVGLGAILALKPRKFDWKSGKGKDIKGDRGFIAQEFEQVFPQLVDQWADEAPEGEAPYKSVRQDLIPVLVKAIQELTARVQTLETR